MQRKYIFLIIFFIISQSFTWFYIFRLGDVEEVTVQIEELHYQLQTVEKKEDSAVFDVNELLQAVLKNTSLNIEVLKTNSGILQHSMFDINSKLSSIDSKINAQQLSTLQQLENLQSQIKTLEATLQSQIDHLKQVGAEEQQPQTKLPASNILPRGMIIPHSHCDAGWLKTFEGYYKESVESILTTVTNALLNNKTRRFGWVEIGFLQRWWKDQSDQMKAKFIQLIKNKQIEIVMGGLVSNDEASVTYMQAINQMTEGHRFLQEEVDETIRPRIGWQIDPFGLSKVTPSLFSQMCFDANVAWRVSEPIMQEYMQNSTLEFLWRSSDSLGAKSDLLMHLLAWSYSSGDYLFTKEPSERNITFMANKLATTIKERVSYYENNNDNTNPEASLVMFLWGHDFAFTNATLMFNTMDAIFKEVNSKPYLYNVTLEYATPSEYFAAIQSRNNKYEMRKSRDYMAYGAAPYGAISPSPIYYWTGYYTSHPLLKKLVRELDGYQRLAEFIYTAARLMTSYNHVIGNSNNHNEGKYGTIFWEDIFVILEKVRVVQGILQHHDAITGTMRVIVYSDYIDMISSSVDSLRSLISVVLPLFLSVEEQNTSSLSSFNSISSDHTSLISDDSMIDDVIDDIIDDDKLQSNLQIRTAPKVNPLTKPGEKPSPPTNQNPIVSDGDISITIEWNRNSSSSSSSTEGEEGGEDGIIVVINTLAWNRTEYITIDIPSPNYLIYDDNNQRIKSDVLLNWGNDLIARGYRLYFKIEVPQLGYRLYRIRNEERSQNELPKVYTSSSKYCAKYYSNYFPVGEVKNTSDAVWIGNEFLRLHFAFQTRLSSLSFPPRHHGDTNRKSKKSAEYEKEGKENNNDDDNNNNNEEEEKEGWKEWKIRHGYAEYASGKKDSHYVFSTTGRKEKSGYTTSCSIITKSNDVSEVVIFVTAEIKQMYRVYATSPIIEIEEIVKPGVSSNLVSVITTSLQTNNTFFTDDSGLEMIERSYDDELPIEANFFPIVYSCYLRDHRTENDGEGEGEGEERITQMSYLTSNSRGVSSPLNGVLEVMLHRNTPDTSLNGEQLGDYDVVRLKSWLLFRDEENKQRQYHAMRLNFPVFSSYYGNVDFAKFPETQKSFLSSSFPTSIHLTTYQHYNRSEQPVAVRVNHLRQNDGVDHYDWMETKLEGKVRLPLRSLLSNDAFSVESMRERTLSFNSDPETCKRYHWHYHDENHVDVSSSSSPSSSSSSSTMYGEIVAENNLNNEISPTEDRNMNLVTIDPMAIRSFFVSTHKKKDVN